MSWKRSKKNILIIKCKFHIEFDETRQEKLIIDFFSSVPPVLNNQINFALWTCIYFILDKKQLIKQKLYIFDIWIGQ